MGKGKFIMELAQMNPDINYVGIERYSSVLLRGLQKRAELELSNIYFMRIDALELTDCLLYTSAVTDPLNGGDDFSDLFFLKIEVAV